MSSYRHQNPRGPVHHQQQQAQYYRQHIQRAQHQGINEIPSVLAPHVALGLLLALLLIPLILLFASELGGFGQYLSGGMFRNLGLGLAYPKWKDGQRPSYRRSGGEYEIDSDGGSGTSDGKRKARKHRQSNTGKDKEKKKVVINGVDNGKYYYAGLVNISGTYCFMNSVVQALASLEHLKPYIAAVQERAEELDVPTPVIDALRDAMTALNTPRKRPTTLRPLPLIEALSSPLPDLNHPGQPPASSRTSALFSSREHQDAQELFVLLSERVKDEALVVERECKQSGIGLRGFDHSITGGRNGRGRVKNPFDGLTANRRSCVQCGYTEAVMHFHFSCWSLSLPRAHTLHLEDCLADYTRLELLDDCVCRKCSLVATLERISVDVARIAGSATTAIPPVKPLTTSSAQNKKQTQTRFAPLQDGEAAPSSSSQTNGDAHSPSTAAAGTDAPNGLSESKKRRLRDLRKLESRLKEMIEEGRVEEEIDLPSSSTATATNNNSEKSKKRLKKEKEKEKAVTLERVVSKCSTRQSMVARPPPILAIHLSRTLHFGAHATKNSANVVFERELDITPYTTSGRLSTRPEAPISSHPESSRMGRFGATGERSRARSVTPTPDRVRGRYRLVSVVCHYGSAGWGHYVCYRRRPEVKRNREQNKEGKEGNHPNNEGDSDSNGSGSGEEDTAPNWIRTSDSQVDYVSWEQVKMETNSVFMLFYERVVLMPDPAHGHTQGLNLASSMTSSMTGSWMASPSPSPAPMTGLGNANLNLSMSTPALRQVRVEASDMDLQRSLQLEKSDIVDPDGPIPRAFTRGELRGRSPSISSQETIRPRVTLPKNQPQSEKQTPEQPFDVHPLEQNPVSAQLQTALTDPVSVDTAAEAKFEEKEKEEEPGSKFTTFVVTSTASKQPSIRPRPMTPSSTFGSDSLGSLTDGLENTPTMSTLSTLSLGSDDSDSILGRGSDVGSSFSSSSVHSELDHRTTRQEDGPKKIPNGDAPGSSATRATTMTSPKAKTKVTKQPLHNKNKAMTAASSLGGPKSAVPTSNTIGLQAY